MKLKKRIKIDHRWVGGSDDPCFIIAEAGSNHNRDFITAKKLINAAKKAGADAVKFQTYSAETLYPKDKKPLRLVGDKDKPFNIIKKVELPREWQKRLAKYASEQKIIFMSTPFDKQSIDELNEIVPAFKWASLELIDMVLLEYAAKKNKPLIISTGFYGIKEIRDALKWVTRAKNNNVALLHCTGLYPTELEDANIRAILTMKKIFNVPVGFSDHTLSTVVPAAAVAIGAKIIEKHFTLDRSFKGPDHPFALEPDELKEMVENIRNVEKSLGSVVKKPVLKEMAKEKLLRRGIVSSRKISKGEIISENNIITKRTGLGAILPSEFYNIKGKKAKHDIKEDQMIKNKDLLFLA